jgi:hypothetical protein
MPDITMTDAAPSLLHVVLTGRPPVAIHEADWPIIADGAGRPRRAHQHLRVRRHADGRVLVYGPREYSRHFVGRYYGRGVLLDLGAPMVEIVGAIHAVCTDLAAADGRNGQWYAVAQECIADLPVEAI